MSSLPQQLTNWSDFLSVEPPTAPSDFRDYWLARYTKAMQVNPLPTISHCSSQWLEDFECFDLSYFSTDSVKIGGWLTIPRAVPVTRAIIVGHGYGGCPEPSSAVPLQDAAYLWPCLRGLGRSKLAGIPQDPAYHVLYDLDKPDRYILGGCVEDIWTALSALEKLFPFARGRIGLIGTSFSGGIGALATAADNRIRLAHLDVPTFGHHQLRMSLPSIGSAKALQGFYRQHPQVLDTLAYFDAANAAQFIQVPVLIAAALIDPVVHPAGQFAIYNALQCKRDLFVLDQGHSEYANSEQQRNKLLGELKSFFAEL